MEEPTHPLFCGQQWVQYQGQRRWLRGVLHSDPTLGLLATPHSPTLGMYEQVRLDELTLEEEEP